jgi:hypothetical protein
VTAATLTGATPNGAPECAGTEPVACLRRSTIITDSSTLLMAETLLMQLFCSGNLRGDCRLEDAPAPVLPVDAAHAEVFDFEEFLDAVFRAAVTLLG